MSDSASQSPAKTRRWLSHGITVIILVVGIFVNAIAVNGLYRPNGFLSGGISGLSVLLNYITSFPAWLFLLLMNIPIMILALIKLPLKFALMSTLAQGLNVFFMNITEGIQLGVENAVAAAVIGGAVTAFMSALAVRRGVSFGGLDVLTYLLSKKISISMGVFGTLFNGMIVLVFGFIRGLDAAFVTIIGHLASMVAFNAAAQGFNRSKTVFIISEKWDEIAPHLMNRLQRGVTYLTGEGAYTGKPRKVVYCMMKTIELDPAKKIVLEHDPKAFFSVIDTKEVIGRGFGGM